MDEKSFKKDNRKDVCSKCPKKKPCALADSICELVTPCAVCEIRETCTTLCPQMKAYLARGSKGEPNKTSFDASEYSQNYYSLKVINSNNEETIEREHFNTTDIPWDILSERDQQIVKELFVEDMTYEEVAKSNNLSVRGVYTIIHGDKTNKGVLIKLKETAISRRQLKKFGKYLPAHARELLTEVFVHNKTAKQLKKLDETIKNTYSRINKAKLLLQKFEVED